MRLICCQRANNKCTLFAESHKDEPVVSCPETHNTSVFCPTWLWLYFLGQFFLEMIGKLYTFHLFSPSHFPSSRILVYFYVICLFSARATQRLLVPSLPAFVQKRQCSDSRGRRGGGGGGKSGLGGEKGDNRKRDKFYPCLWKTWVSISS